MRTLADNLRSFTFELEREAGIKDWLKKLLSVIQGIPSEEKALGIVGDFMEKNPHKFEGTVNTIYETLKNIPLAGLGRTANDPIKAVKDLAGKLRVGLPLVLSILVLMESAGTADAKVLERTVQQQMAPKEHKTPKLPTSVWMALAIDKNDKQVSFETFLTNLRRMVSREFKDLKGDPTALSLDFYHTNKVDIERVAEKYKETPEDILRAITNHMEVAMR